MAPIFDHMNQIFNRNKFKGFCSRTIELVWEKDVFFNASAISFNLFICSIPFALILTSILGYILSIDAAFDELVRYGRELFPQFSFENRSGDVIEGAVTLERLIVPMVRGRQIFGIAGLIILVVFAQSLFHTLKHVLFNIYDIKDRKHPLIEIIYNFFTSGIIGGVFIIFSIFIWTISLFNTQEIVIPYTEVVIELEWLPEMFTNVIPVGFTFVLFYIIYRYISEKRLGRKVSLIGALFYTLLFEIARTGVSFYLDYALLSYRYLYQGYTILIILGLWVFYAALLFVISTILARSFQEIYLPDKTLVTKNPYTDIS
ncbi:MAG: YihY/virulence factor BrkB family protein [Balneolaceae bacterium]